MFIGFTERVGLAYPSGRGCAEGSTHRIGRQIGFPGWGWGRRDQGWFSNVPHIFWGHNAPAQQGSLSCLPFSLLTATRSGNTISRSLRAGTPARPQWCSIRAGPSRQFGFFFLHLFSFVSVSSSYFLLFLFFFFLFLLYVFLTKYFLNLIFLNSETFHI